MHQAKRGVFDLRCGQVVRIADGGGEILVVAVEAIDSDRLDELRYWSEQPPSLLLTGQRARAVGLCEEDSNGIALELAAGGTLADTLELAGGEVDEQSLRRLRGEARPVNGLEQCALDLAKAGRLIPALVAIPLSRPPTPDLGAQLRDGRIITVTADQVRSLGERPALALQRVTDAKVPLADADEARFVLFRDATGMLEHVAVLIGNPAEWPADVAVRLHSACLTGDLFDSLRCDCGDQLRNSVRSIAAQGGGVLLYLAQEGRGIGLANKLRAYGIQDLGLDTVEANHLLGFSEDERRYEAAVAMLRQLGVRRVRLLTNNPLKVEALQQAGVRVVERVPLYGTVNLHNRRYLDTKASRSGHALDALLRRVDGNR